MRSHIEAIWRLGRALLALPVALLGLGFVLPQSSSEAASIWVVCGDELRPGLDRWVEKRQEQGYDVDFVSPNATAIGTLRAMIDRSRQPPEYVLLVGDAPKIGNQADIKRQVPTFYQPTMETARFGNTPTFPTDLPYSDLGSNTRPDAKRGDGIPDLAVGRIPAHGVEELSKFVGKLLAHEESDPNEEGFNRIRLVGGLGGFGFVTDRAIETVTRSIVTSRLPKYVRTDIRFASPGHAFYPAGSFREAVLADYASSPRFWIYAGHGFIDSLDRVPNNESGQTILDNASCSQLRLEGDRRPIAVMLACFTAAVDAPQPSIAESMMMLESGPVAVIAAGRMTMPYGNTRLAIELIESVFQQDSEAQRHETMGDAWLKSCRQTITRTESDGLVAVVDSLAGVLTPGNGNQQVERVEHASMYQLLGDPTMRLRHRTTMNIEADRSEDRRWILLNYRSPIDGMMTVHVERSLSSLAGMEQGTPRELKSFKVPVAAGRKDRYDIELTDSMSGLLNVRVDVTPNIPGQEAAAGGVQVMVAR
ncbi:MAG: C25 family cysteine peptidase [Planctomycetota bacterium]